MAGAAWLGKIAAEAHARLAAEMPPEQKNAEGPTDPPAPQPNPLVPGALTAKGAVSVTEERKPEATPLLTRFCVGCHSGDKPKGKLNLENLPPDFQRHEREWKAVLDRLADRSMPPDKKPQPSASERKRMMDSIDRQLIAAQKERAARDGRAVLRRLNRAEYNNTIQDLLGISVDVVEQFPIEKPATGFDTVDTTLDLSPQLLARYMEVADVALDAAHDTRVHAGNFKPHFDINEQAYETKNPSKAKAVTRTFFFPDVWVQKDRCIYFSTVDLRRDFRDHPVPVAGTYKIRVKAASYQPQGRSVSLVFYVAKRIYGEGRAERFIGAYDLKETPSVIEFSARLQAGEIVEVRPWGLPNPRPKELIKYRYAPVPEEVAEKYKGPGAALYWAEVEGPFPTNNPSAYTELLHHVKPGKGKIADAEKIIRRLLPRAFRRPVTDKEIQTYVGLVQSRLGNGYSFEDALRVGMKAILCSPNFLYLQESPARLTDTQLAARLSYFLWSTMPDDDLLVVATTNGELGKPEVLRVQVERMLKDPKAHHLTDNFAGQWLNLREVENLVPPRKFYPEYDDLLLKAMMTETRLYFEEMLKNNHSLLEFVNSDWSFLNERLAEHYGIADVKGQAFRKVTLPKSSHRGGVLTQGAVLMGTTDGNHTSPVLRGAWVLDRILGMTPPPPPLTVEAVTPDGRGAVTVREQLAKHRSVAACASCHRTIDPPGFALENFDVIGGWRDRYRVSPSKQYQIEQGKRVMYAEGPPVESADNFPGKGKFRNIDDFKQLLLKDKDQLARALAEKLVTYGTGHKTEYADRDRLDPVVSRVREQGYGFRTLIHEIVQSELFRNK
jgi:hypothetical protein